MTTLLHIHSSMVERKDRIVHKIRQYHIELCDQLVCEYRIQLTVSCMHAIYCDIIHKSIIYYTYGNILVKYVVLDIVKYVLCLDTNSLTGM